MKKESGVDDDSKMQYFPLSEGLPLRPNVCSILISSVLSYDDVKYPTTYRSELLIQRIFQVIVETAKVWPKLEKKDWQQIRGFAPLFKYEGELPEWKDLYFSDSEGKDIQ